MVEDRGVDLLLVCLDRPHESRGVVPEFDAAVLVRGEYLFVARRPRSVEDRGLWPRGKRVTKSKYFVFEGLVFADYLRAAPRFVHIFSFVEFIRRSIVFPFVVEFEFFSLI